MSVCRACLMSRSQASLYLDLTYKRIHAIHVYLVPNERPLQLTRTTLTDMYMYLDCSGDSFASQLLTAAVEILSSTLKLSIDLPVSEKQGKRMHLRLLFAIQCTRLLVRKESESNV
jgi:hypothetical protein